MTSPERIAKLKEFVSSEQDAWAMFARAPSIRFAAVHEGRPVVRTLSGVVHDGALCFHGADDGEKLALLGGPAIASWDEVIAQVPSYWIHPELACPASTYYLSAIAEGELARVDDPVRKAAVLRALMERYQPEGGYAPIAHDDKRYRKVVEELLVVELRPRQIAAKRKLGQHRSKNQIERVLEGLWKRGASGDLRAIRLIREAHPDDPRPGFLRGPDGSDLCVAPDADDALQVAQLLAGQYWTGGFASEQLARAQLASPAWVVARRGGEVVASARVVSDGVRTAWLMDVIVHPSLRGRRYGSVLTQLALAHPAVRSASRVRLRTRTPEFYQPFGFVRADAPMGIEMERRPPMD